MYGMYQTQQVTWLSFGIVRYTGMIGFSCLSMLIMNFALEFPGGVICLRHPYVGYRLCEDFLVKLLGIATRKHRRKGEVRWHFSQVASPDPAQKFPLLKSVSICS